MADERCTEHLGSRTAGGVSTSIWPLGARNRRAVRRCVTRLDGVGFLNWAQALAGIVLRPHRLADISTSASGKPGK